MEEKLLEQDFSGWYLDTLFRRMLVTDISSHNYVYVIKYYNLPTCIQFLTQVCKDGICVMTTTRVIILVSLWLAIDILIDQPI